MGFVDDLDDHREFLLTAAGRPSSQPWETWITVANPLTWLSTTDFRCFWQPPRHRVGQTGAQRVGFRPQTPSGVPVAALAGQQGRVGVGPVLAELVPSR
jgi:hypothetical protein